MRTPSCFIHFVKIASFFVDFLYEKTSRPITILSLDSWLLALASSLLSPVSWLFSPPSLPTCPVVKCLKFIRTFAAIFEKNGL